MAFDRLRFDFNFNRPLKEHELGEIELMINQWIGEATLLEMRVMALAGAIAMFGEKYGEKVLSCLNMSYLCLLSISCGLDEASFLFELIFSKNSLGACCGGSWCIHGAMWWNSCKKYIRNTRF